MVSSLEYQIVETLFLGLFHTAHCHNNKALDSNEGRHMKGGPRRKRDLLCPTSALCSKKELVVGEKISSFLLTTIKRLINSLKNFIIPFFTISTIALAYLIKKFPRPITFGP